MVTIGIARGYRHAAAVLLLVLAASFVFLWMMFLLGSVVAAFEDPTFTEIGLFVAFVAGPLMFALTGFMFFLPWLAGSGLLAGMCTWVLLRSTSNKTAQVAVTAALGAVLGPVLVGIAYWQFRLGLVGIVPIPGVALALISAAYGGTCAYLYIRSTHRNTGSDSQ